MPKSCLSILCLLLIYGFRLSGQSVQDIADSPIKAGKYLPDFSYAGYRFGESVLPNSDGAIVLYAIDNGVIPNDELDDSEALIRLIGRANEIEGPVRIQLPAGRIILSDILYLERSNIILSGAGSGENGTDIYIPRPMKYLSDPNDLQELREYLISQNKVQKEKEKNIHIPFSQYAWSGGMIWTRFPGARVKSYLKKYDQPINVLAKVATAERGSFSFEVGNSSKLRAGEVVELQWFNKQGEKALIISELYGELGSKIGSHHWKYPDLAIVRQQVQIEKIEGNMVTIKSPLLINIRPEYEVKIAQWDHLEEVGFEHFKITFPYSNYIAHHVEQGYNGIYLTRVFNSWVRDVVIENADSGILTEAIANTTIADVVTTGEKKAHYTVQVGGVHNVLIKNLSVKNLAVHPLSFNTFATRSVYTDCEVYKSPILDQHSGANHQNLFDNIKVHVLPNSDGAYPLFAGGGASYWKPSHGSFSTFWNIQVKFMDQEYATEPILLNGMKEGSNAIVVGVNGDKKIKVSYGPNAFIAYTNNSMSQIPSLYNYQLQKRLLYSKK